MHLFLKNTSEAPVEIGEVFLNGEVLKDLPERDLAVWVRTAPNPVGPGEVGNLMIMLHASVFSYDMPLDVKAITTCGQTVETQVEEIQRGTPLTGICFSSDLDKIYVYFENITDSPDRPGRILLNAEDVTARSKIHTMSGTAEPAGSAPADQQRATSNKQPQSVRPEEKCLIKINLREPLRQGRYVSVRVETEGGHIAQSVVRAFSFFPITSWDDDTRRGLYFDAEPFHVSSPGDKSEEELQELTDRSAWYLMGCPNCRDTRSDEMMGHSAGSIINSAETAYRIDPTRPGHTHVCDPSKEITYFLYGEVCDIMFINPYEIVFRDADPLLNGLYARLAAMASGPRPVMTLPEAFEVRERGWLFPSPEQLRLSVYYQIAEGVKGISYYEKQFYSESPELEAEIGSINKELRAMKPYLKISEPFRGLAETSDPEVKAHTLACGDHGLALILINTDYETEIIDDERQTNVTPREDFYVEVELPEWLGAGQVFRVGESIGSVDFETEDNRVTVPVSRLDLTGMYLIHPGER